jgi:hypothetical protein
MLAVSAVLIALYTSLTSTSIMLVVAQPLLTGDLPWMLYAAQITAAIMHGSDALSVTDAQLRQLAGALPVVYIYALLFSLPRLVLSNLVVFILLGLAWALYRAHPAWTRRRQQLRTLPELPRPERARALESLVQSAAMTAGVAPPTIMVRRHPQNDAAIFGTHGRYILRLNAWPLGASVDELDELGRREATPLHTQILHELGHIANNDVWRSRAARAIWDIFIWLVSVPLALATLYFVIRQIVRLLAVAEGEQLGQVIWAHSQFLSFALQLIAVVLVVRASHAALLRVREYYADWRAVLWGAGEQITMMLDQKARADEAAQPPQTGHRAALQQFWQRLWSFHTSARDRLEHIKRPLLLFHVSWDLAFHTGILLAFVTVGLMSIMFSMGSSIAEVIELSLWLLIRLTIDLPAPLNRQAYLAIIVMMRLIVPLSLGLSVLLVVVYLIIGSLGRQMQRAAVADLLPTSGRPWGYMGLWRVAFLLALGQEFGFLILPRSAFVIRDLVSLLLIPLWTVIFSTLIWFWLVYVRAFSQRMLGTHSGRHLPRAKRWLVSGCTITALLLLCFPVVAGRVLIVNAPLLADSSTPFQQLSPDIPLAYLFGSITLFLLLGAIALFMLWTIVTLSIAYLWSIWRRPVCPRCDLQSRELFAVGRRCSNCYAQLAPWLFVPPRRNS